MPANEPALLILTGLTLSGVEESNLAATPEGLWTTEAECRPREVEYIAVADQNSPGLVYFRFTSLSATSSTAGRPSTDSTDEKNTTDNAGVRVWGNSLVEYSSASRLF